MIPAFLKRKEALLIILLLALPTLAYLNTLQNGFVWDDKYIITDNPYVRDIGNIPSYFISSATQGSYDMKVYRPLRQMMFTVEYTLWGNNHFGYHLINILLHAINCILVYKLLTHFLLSRSAAILATLFYSIHPVHTEAVANITGRTDILFLCFYLAGLLFYIKAGNGRCRSSFLCLAVISYCLSLFSKEMAVTFPLIILLTDLCLGEKKVDRLTKATPFYLLLVFITAAYLILRTSAIAGIGQGEYHADSLYITLLSQSAVFWKYTKLFFLPLPLSARYDIVLIEHFFNPYTIGLISAITAMTAATIIYLRKGQLPLFIFGIWWFFITLLPVSNIIPISAAMMGERYLYLPTLGLCIALFSLIDSYISRGYRTVFISILFVPLLAAFFYLTHSRNTVWKDDRTLFEDTVKKAPDSLAVHWNLFEIYRNSGEKKKAAQQYREMKRINEDTARGLLEIAIRYKNKGAFGDAERMAKKALHTKPDFKEAEKFLDLLREKRNSLP